MKPRHGASRIAALYSVAALLAGACTAVPPTPAPEATTGPSIPPTASPVESASPTASGSGKLHWTPQGRTEVSGLRVPLDYANPAAGTIWIALGRRRAADSAHRLGVLLFNPGGPGEPAMGFPGVDGLNTVIPQAILDRFDFVTWDPRGVGLSQGLTCPDSETLSRVLSLDPTPSSAPALDSYRAAYDGLATQCQRTSGRLLPYLSEATTARDIDAIRDALGEQTISYLGGSYGTYLGYLYATRYPTHVRAAILDGPFDPTHDLVARDLDQANGFEAAFRHFAELCAAASRCPFHGGGDPVAAYDALISRLRRSPESDVLDAGHAVTGTLWWLFSRDYAGLADALSNTERGDGRALRHSADAMFSEITLGAYLSTTCLDVGGDRTVAAIERDLAAARKASPHFGPLLLLTDQFGCLDWPVPSAPIPATGPPAGLPPILVIAGRWDPATPLANAEPLAKALGSGVVLTRDGLGHTSGDSATTDECLRSAIVSYLIDLTPPPAGTICADPSASFWP